MMTMDIAPEVVGEDKTWRFIGIWAKNRWEWTNTLLAGMHYKITTVGFYDAQSEEQVDYIVNQTEMSSIVCTEDYAKKVVDMKAKGMVPSVQKLIIVTAPTPELIQSASAASIDVFTYD
jgi:long-chain acyl-CoA synthetase